MTGLLGLAVEHRKVSRLLTFKPTSGAGRKTLLFVGLADDRRRLALVFFVLVVFSFVFFVLFLIIVVIVRVARRCDGEGIGSQQAEVLGDAKGHIVAPRRRPAVDDVLNPIGRRPAAADDLVDFILLSVSAPERGRFRPAA